MRRWPAAIAAGALLLALLPVGAAADPCSPAASSASCTPPPTPPPTSTADQQIIEQARQQLGNEVADALSTVQQLSELMSQNAGEQSQVQQRVEASQAKLDELDQEIQQLDDQIAATQQRIEEERTEIGIMARELYQQPDSLLLRLLRAGSLRDLVTQTGDLTAAALRADALRQRLTSDLAKLQQDETDRQNARDQEAQVQDELSSALGQLQDLAQREQDSSDQLQSAIGDSQSALDSLGTQGAAVAQQVAAMLVQKQEQLIATAEQQVWQQEQLWTTLNSSAIPPPLSTTLGVPSSGTPLAWPIQGAVLTQGFGPSTLWLEPAMYGYPHFHTGLDLASPDTRITAAADGVVAVVGSGTTGYGNYVIIVHGGGLVTLYGHLSLTVVKAGDTITQGQQIGVEGSTGASTGVHLHFEVRLNGTPVDPSPFLPPLGTA
jgi:murein DD-endopeptidase MepM/ murein hydrolase activator NlpD